MKYVIMCNVLICLLIFFLDCVNILLLFL
jgi:hypothetical protein